MTEQIVNKTMEREERPISLETIPGDGRVREVKLDSVGERKARLWYVNVAGWRTG